MRDGAVGIADRYAVVRNGLSEILVVDGLMMREEAKALLASIEYLFLKLVVLLWNRARGSEVDRLCLIMMCLRRKCAKLVDIVFLVHTGDLSVRLIRMTAHFGHK